MKILRHSLTALALGAALSLSAATPRYIFYFIGDGMGMGQIMAGQTYNRVALGNPDQLLMMQFPVAGMLQTYSASGTVTDSAAAGTALATGSKTKNGMLGMDADTTSVTSMAAVLHDAGWGVGLVTTVAPDDATPGAFYAHVPARWMTEQIGRQAADCGYEFIAGSAWRGAKDGKGNDTGLIDYIKRSGVDMVTDTAAVAASKSRRVFLNSAEPFSESNVGFTIDSIPGALTLPAMTEAAISHMQKVTPERFFMMVEGGNIDHVGHSNDGATVAVEVVNFNEALAKAYDFYLQHPDETLIVVTADHETGGMSIGNGHVGYNSYLEYVPLQRMSKDRFSEAVTEGLKSGELAEWDAMKEFARANTGLWGEVKVSEKQEQRLHQLFDETVANKGAEGMTEHSLYSSFGAFAAELYRVLNANQGFGWTTGNHTGNPVPVFAIGEGTEVFGKMLDNTRVAPELMRLAGFADFGR